MAAAGLQLEARLACRDMKPGDGLPEKAFVTDGCSSFLDGSWVMCCVEHDIPYWCGGSREQRRQADRDLDACISETSSGFLGTMMYLGVRMGGHPVVPAGWRWGYGRDYPAGYAPAPESPAPEP